MEVWRDMAGVCLSGKDPSKVDRSAAYAGRYVAKNIVSAGLAENVKFKFTQLELLLNQPQLALIPLVPILFLRLR